MANVGAKSVTRARDAGLVLAACVCLALPAPASTEASVPPTRCGKIKVNGKTYKVSAHRLKCDFARRWSKRYLKSRDKRRGWSCQRYPPEETKIAFTCRKKGKDYYAVRK